MTTLEELLWKSEANLKESNKALNPTWGEMKSGCMMMCCGGGGDIPPSFNGFTNCK